MISRRIRYITLSVALGSLIVSNIVVHIVSMNLSEGSLAYEKKISILKQSNQKLESETLSQYSLQTVAEFAASEGYVSSGPATRWVEPVIAAR